LILNGAVKKDFIATRINGENSFKFIMGYLYARIDKQTASSVIYFNGLF